LKFAMQSSIPSEVDVLVVGYGPVGAAVTCLLGQYGVRTLVIDKAPDIFLAPRAIVLDNDALRVLQWVGLPEGAFARLPIPQVRMVCPYLGEFGRFNTSGTIDGHPKLVSFFQPDMERALRRQVATHTSVTVATGVELEHFAEEDGAVLARLTTADGVQHAVRAKYLVGADGANSKVRTVIGQDFDGKTYAEDWLIVDAQDVPGNFDHVEFLCDPRRPTPHMVAPGGRTRWEFKLSPGETREEMLKDETIQRLLAPWAVGAELKIERKAVYRFHARSCERYSRGRVFLVGDAAHITPPFIGQGLVSGLRDAANLAWKLAWVVRGRARDSILESYDQERRPHATKMIELAQLMGQLVMPRNAALAVLVHGALKLVRSVPGLREHVDELGLKPKPQFKKGLFVKGRGKLRRGGMLGQVRARTESGDVRLSDDLLGPALTLVGLGAEVDAQLSPETRRRWASHGGMTLQLEPEVFEDAATIEALPRGWCAVVRPDRTILHDGPASQANRVAREALALLEA
jgi:3-(3-hydroxy-phenyl)propionate hydroxylase